MISPKVKDAARQKLRYEVKRGRIIRPKECSLCGPTPQRIEAHHPDYTKPLDVIWVCTNCHNFKFHDTFPDHPNHLKRLRREAEGKVPVYLCVYEKSKKAIKVMAEEAGLPITEYIEQLIDTEFKKLK